MLIVLENILTQCTPNIRSQPRSVGPVHSPANVAASLAIAARKPNLLRSPQVETKDAIFRIVFNRQHRGWRPSADRSRNRQSRRDLGVHGKFVERLVVQTFDSSEDDEIIGSDTRLASCANDWRESRRQDERAEG
jgi:hypothetical protein